MKHIIGAFLCTTLFLHGMSEQDKMTVRELALSFLHAPEDEQGMIFEHMQNRKNAICPLYTKDQKDYPMYLPTTIPLNLVRFRLWDDGEYKPGADYFVPRFAVRKHATTQGIACDNFFNEYNKRNWVTNFAGTNVIFDGINDNNKGILFIYNGQNDSYKGYYFHKTYKKKILSGYVEHEGKGVPVSCTLDLCSNDFLLLRQHEGSYFLDLKAISGWYNIFKPIVEVSLPYSAVAVASFGNDIYGLLTDDGQFKTVVYERDTNQLCLKNQKHGTLRFKHLAINPDDVNERGFRPCFALLTVPNARNEAELFVCDLRKFEKPTLLLAHTVSNAHLVKRLYYKSSALRLMMSDAQEPTIIAQSKILNDNFNVLLRKVLINKFVKKELADSSEGKSAAKKEHHQLVSAHKRQADISEDEPPAKRACRRDYTFKKRNT